MYILNIVRAIKNVPVNEVRDLYLKTIVNELHFLKKAVFIQWDV